MTETLRARPLVAGLAFGLALSITGCLVLAYLWIDRSISLSYLDSSNRQTEKAYGNIALLLEREWRDLPEHEIWKRLESEIARRPKDRILLKREPNESFIWFDDTRFEFEGGRLARIR